jgi:hypothetical protein
MKITLQSIMNLKVLETENCYENNTAKYYKLVSVRNCKVL